MPSSEDQQPTSVAIKVAIVEDLREVREGLAMLINGTDGFLCVGRFRSMEEAIANLSREMPDVVLTDIGLPGMDGIAGIKILHEKFPDLPFIALTVYDDDERIFDALCAGACGYLLKNTPAGTSARIIARGQSRRRADVAGSCSACHHFVSKFHTAKKRRLSPDTA